MTTPAGLPEDARPHTLGGMLNQLAAAHPDAPALVDPLGGQRSFADLSRDCAALALRLSTMGLRGQERLVAVADHGVLHARVLLACASNACTVPVATTATQSEYEAAVTSGGASAVVVWDDIPEALAACLQRLPIPCIRLASLPASSGAQADRQCPHPNDVAFLIWTSGSTSLPKRVPITHAALQARAQKTQLLLGIGPTDRCLCLMPLNYAHGINSGLLGPILAGGASILPSQVDKGSFLAGLAAGATWYTAGAAHQNAALRWLQEGPGQPVRHSLRFVRSGSAALPSQVAEGLESILGVPVFESYSSSETGTMTANSPCMARKPGTVGRSTGNDLRIVDEEGRRLPAGSVGEIIAGGPTLSLPYEGESALAAEAFREGWFHTGDLGEVDAEGYLTLRGRIKEQINRGGQKISPSELDACALTLPGVVDSACFPVPHPTLGEDAYLAVVLAPGVSTTGEAILQEMATAISAAKLPRRVLVVPDIPRAQGNKLRRRELATHFQALISAAAGGDEHAEPTLLARLVALWRLALRNPRLDAHANFFEHGGDSLLAAELADLIGKDFGTEPRLSDIAQFPTPALFYDAACAQELLGGLDTLRFNTGGTRRPLFAFPGRFGHALRISRLAPGLGADQPIYALQPPGMDWVPTGCVTLEQMAAHYIRRIREIQPEGPYQLMGASFGGLVAFEIARQLQQAGQQVCLLALIDTGLPTVQLGKRGARPTFLDVQGQLAPARNQSELEGQRVAIAHQQARSQYVVSATFDGEITYMLCECEGIAAGLDPRRWWRHLATKGVRLLTVAGPHSEYHVEPQLSAVVAVLQASLGGNPPPSCSYLDVFLPVFRLRRAANGDPLQLDAPRHKALPIAGRVPGRIDPAQLVGPYLRVSGWAAAPSGTEPAQWLLVFLNGRFLGRVGTGLAASPSSTDAHVPPAHSGFLAHFPLREALPVGRPSELRIFITHDDALAYRL